MEDPGGWPGRHEPWRLGGGVSSKPTLEQAAPGINPDGFLVIISTRLGQRQTEANWSFRSDAAGHFRIRRRADPERLCRQIQTPGVCALNGKV